MPGRWTLYTPRMHAVDTRFGRHHPLPLAGSFPHIAPTVPKLMRPVLPPPRHPLGPPFQTGGGPTPAAPRQFADACQQDCEQGTARPTPRMHMHTDQLFNLLITLTTGYPSCTALQAPPLDRSSKPRLKNGLIRHTPSRSNMRIYCWSLVLTLLRHMAPNHTC